VLGNAIGQRTLISGMAIGFPTIEPADNSDELKKQLPEVLGNGW
jgi:hypothetical protein